MKGGNAYKIAFLKDDKCGKLFKDIVKFNEVKTLRYFWTFFWTFLLIQMASYVIGSMQAATYSFQTASVVAVIVTALIIILGSVIPNEPVEEPHH